MKRQMSVAGSFYPARSSEIERYFEHFSTVFDEERKIPDIKSRVVIVPHAGYIYSGYSANVAYRVLQNSGCKRFVIIGPSHRVGFDGISLCDFDSYETPFGDIEADRQLVQTLQDKFMLSCHRDTHFEHSTEVQFPFLKHYIDAVSIVELVYSFAKPIEISQIIDFILEQKDIGVIVSTDLSHFYTLSNAVRLDNICIEALQDLDTKRLHSGCEACGILGVEALMLSAKKKSLKPRILDYRTSADASGDTDRVVGYVSVAFES